MTATAGDRPSSGKDDGSQGASRAVPAGRVGRAHGLDGSFYVTGARPRLLVLGTLVTVAEKRAKVVRRAGTDAHPIVRLGGITNRGEAEQLRGAQLTVDIDEAPRLGEGEWWAAELEGCEVFDGKRRLGIVTKLIELPSCEALEVSLVAADPSAQSSATLLVPMVRDAIRHVDPAHGRIDVNMDFLEDSL